MDTQDQTNLETRRLFQHVLPVRQEGGDGATESTLGQILSVVESLANTNPARSNTWFVGKHGDDSNTGRTPGTAFLTIAAAHTAATAGDTIMVGPGSYSEDLTFTKQLTLHAPTTEIVGSITTNSLLDLTLRRLVAASGATTGYLFQTTLASSGDMAEIDIGVMRTFGASTAPDCIKIATAAAVRTSVTVGSIVLFGGAGTGVQIDSGTLTLNAKTITDFNQANCNGIICDNGSVRLQVTNLALSGSGGVAYDTTHASAVITGFAAAVVGSKNPTATGTATVEEAT